MHTPCVHLGEVTSNSAESYNKAIFRARELPITHLVDSLRQKLVTWLSGLTNELLVYFGYVMRKMWDEPLAIDRTWMPHRITSTIYEFPTEPPVVVNLSERT